MKQVEIWLKGMLAAAISGAAGGVLTGLAVGRLAFGRRRCAHRIHYTRVP